MAITINVNLDEILAALKNDLDFTGNANKYIKVNATADGFEFAAVSAPTWGAITGTLSSQTDLQSALDLKANLSGAAFTGDVSVTTSGSGDTLQLTNSGSGTTLNILNSGSGDFFKIDTDKLVVDNGGDVSIGTAAASARFHVLTGSTSKVGAIIQAAAGQTADLFQLKKSNGNTGMVVKGTGTALVMGEAATTALAPIGLTVYTNSAGVVIGSGPSDAIYFARNYMQRTGAANSFDFYGSSAIVATINSNKWKVAASVSGGARFNWIDGVAPSSPADGDMWRVGDVLYLRDGATTKSITFT